MQNSPVQDTIRELISSPYINWSSTTEPRHDDFIITGVADVGRTYDISIEIQSNDGSGNGGVRLKMRGKMPPVGEFERWYPQSSPSAIKEFAEDCKSILRDFQDGKPPAVLTTQRHG